MYHILVNLSEPGQGVEEGHETSVERLRASTNEIEAILRRAVGKKEHLLGYLEEVYSVRAQQEICKGNELGIDSTQSLHVGSADSAQTPTLRFRRWFLPSHEGIAGNGEKSRKAPWQPPQLRLVGNVQGQM